MIVKTLDEFQQCTRQIMDAYMAGVQASTEALKVALETLEADTLDLRASNGPAVDAILQSEMKRIANAIDAMIA